MFGVCGAPLCGSWHFFFQRYYFVNILYNILLYIITRPQYWRRAAHVVVQVKRPPVRVTRESLSVCLSVCLPTNFIRITARWFRDKFVIWDVLEGCRKMYFTRGRHTRNRSGCALGGGRLVIIRKKRRRRARWLALVAAAHIIL